MRWFKYKVVRFFFLAAILHLWLCWVKAAAYHPWIAVNIPSRWHMMWNIKLLLCSPFVEKKKKAIFFCISHDSWRNDTLCSPHFAVLTQIMFSFKIQKIVVNLTQLAPPPAHVCIGVCMCVCVWEQERVEGSTSSSVCQRSQSPGSLIPLPGGLENFLSSFPVPSPRWARRATPGKFMLMSAMKTPPPLDRVSQYLSNSGLSILSLSLCHLLYTCSPLSPQIFPFLQTHPRKI